MTAPLKVLALVTDAWGGRGGIAQYNRDFLGAAAESDQVASIAVLPRHAPDPVAAPAKVRQAPARRGRIAYALGAIRAALSGPVDVVFCGHLHMATLALAIARLRGARLVVQAHGIEAWRVPGRARRAAVEAADLVLCVSRDTRARVLDWAAMAPERLVVAPNTVGEAFSPGDGAALRAAWGLDGKAVLLTVGRMDAREQYKGHDRVIAAIPGLAAQGHDPAYVVIGEGDDLPRLRALAAEAGVADRVMFVGPAPHDTKVEAYRMADLFVMPSTGEGFGIAFLEAMASGTPALGLAAAGARDALADGALGAAVAEGDFATALAAALDRPMADGQALAAEVRRRFGRAPFAAATRNVLQRLAEAA